MDYLGDTTLINLLNANGFLDASCKLAHPVGVAAIENGEHQGKVFVFIDLRLDGAEFRDGDHVAKLYNSIMNQFPDRNSAKAAE